MHKRHSSDFIEVYRLPVDRLCPNIEPPAGKVIEQARELLQHKFNTLLASDDRLAIWIRRMQDLDMKAVVFGGWARDRLVEMIHNRNCPSRDVDFVAHGKVSVVESLPDDAILNPFGGFGTEATCIHVDVWNLQDTFLIRRLGLPILFEQLPRTADYTANAVVFKPAQFFAKPEVIERGAINAILHGVLDFSADDVAQPRVQAARAVILSARLQLRPSPTVRSFVKMVCESEDARKAVTKGVLVYCPVPWIDGAISLLNSLLDE